MFAREGLMRARGGSMRAHEGLMRAQVPARRWRIAASSMLAVVSMLVTTATLASDLSLATWNIAWLRERPLTDAEYQQCIAMPAKQRERLDERDLMRWVCRNSAHYAMLARIAARVDPDIIALQEIENVAAAALVFPPDRYQIVVTDSPWIQRVGFAVRKSAATIVKFVDYKALGGPMNERPRGGADLTVRLADGSTLRLLAIHLKSACHSRVLTDTQLGRYDQPGDPPPCKLLASQIAPLEAWIDARVREAVPFVVLGDFNRRLDSSVEREQAASDAHGRPLTMWKALDDGDPPGARLTRVTADRSQIPNCQPRDRSISDEERAMFIDHIVVGQSLGARIVPGSMRQWSLVEGKITRDNRADLRALSDHCPLSVRIRGGA